MQHHIEAISEALQLEPLQVAAVAALLDEGSTIPFIARYRKEATGSLDEVAVTDIRNRMEQLRELDSRRASILKSLEDHGHLNDALRASVDAARTLADLEDIYLPYRPKRRTRAMIAREKGLEPLSAALMAQTGRDPVELAAGFLDPDKGVETLEDALAGARDILAEIINEDKSARERMRELFFRKGTLHSRVVEGKETEGAKYRDYFEWEEPAVDAPSHRVLAMRRGEREDILNLTIAPPETAAVELLEFLFVKGEGADSEQVRLAARDGYKRLLSRSMETEVRLAVKEKADAKAIAVFADNLRELLLAAPLGARNIMAIDPGYRTGCKLVCLDRQGKLLHHETIFPTQSGRQAALAAERARELCGRFEIEAVAVGNGTGGRETEAFLKALDLPGRPAVLMVNESGASVYSASETARNEFPDLDLTVRGAVSIGRRLMDPLAELVKIDPKSIGVGQYQHDVDQGALKQALDDVVVSCVNAVGVDVNQASAELLTYVSGLGPSLARNIVTHRNASGPFRSREALKSVSRLGPKAFEQCAGFLRIQNGDHPLDASAVHPESYGIVESMAKDLGCTVVDLLRNPDSRQRIDIRNYITDTVGLPTLEDIMSELAKPGRDPREPFEQFTFADGIESLEDLRPGMTLPGIVTNVTAFGAFVDIGVHQDGLVHISELADRFVKDPAEVVKVQQKVKVRILDVDLERRRIALSMKSPGEASPNRSGSGNQPDKARPAHRKKRGGGTPRDRKAPSNAPFNNPFADAFRRKGS
ncbi:MAG: Tex family protein [Desulfobacterales bacterium]